MWVDEGHVSLRVVSSKDHRLPRSVVPRRYDLELHPDLDSSTFVGTVSIEVEFKEPTATIVLNAVDLEIESVSIDDGSIEVASFECDNTAETLTIETGRPIPTDTAIVSVSFKGILNDQLKGFYRSVYTDENGNERVLATTQFESTSARYAFPCFDEPAFKAVFGVTLVVDEYLTAISCGPEVDRRTLDGGKAAVRFADTMPISTYVLAFVVGELEMTETVEVRGIPIRVVHVPGKGDLTPFAIEVASFAVAWLEDYFDIAIPVEKLDLVAVPDFAFGAMENHGCLTFRESLLLADVAGATTSELIRVADVICHEIAHMWFGNLVTMLWWEGIWLKEAFATFMETATVDAFRPEWNRWDLFSRDRSAAFAVDSLTTTRAIEFPVNSPDEAEAMFDVLTYEKGAAVVRMLEQHLGESSFRAGVRHYLEKFKGGNTRTTDLWDALEESTGEPVRTTMDSWIFQGGHPMIEVTSTDVGVHIEQSIFRFDGSGSALWSVPVSLRASVDGKVVSSSTLLSEPNAQVDLGGRPRWVVANVGANGFYRVDYEPALASELIQEAQEVMSVAERVAFVDDLVAAVSAQRTEPSRLLELIEEFTYETDLSVWRSMAAGLDVLDRLVSATGNEQAQDRFTDRAGRVLGPALDVLGLEPATGEDPATAELRGLLLRLAGTLGANERAKSLSKQIVDDGPQRTVPELHAAAVTVVASNGDEHDYQRFVEAFETAETPQLQLRFLMALAQFPERPQIDQTLEMCRERVRSQNAPFVIAQCLTHKQHGPRSWSFVSEHWEELTRRFPNNSVPRMLGGIVTVSDPALAEEIGQFIDSNPVPQGGATIYQHLERMRVNVALHAKAATEFSAYLTAT